MKKFADFSKEDRPLEGEKVKIDTILDQIITVIGYRIKNSRFSRNKSGDYLTLQFELNGEKRICFTGSDILIDQTKKYAQEIPFETIIKKINRYYTFT